MPVDRVTAESLRPREPQQVITLNDEDRDCFLQILASDDPPNEALVQAARQFKERYGLLAAEQAPWGGH